MKDRKFTLGHFKKMWKEHVAEDPSVPVDNYIPIMEDLLAEIQKMVIRDTQCFEYPYRFGKLTIVGIVNKAAVDFSEYESKGTVRKNKNIHSNSQIYKFKWDKKQPVTFINHWVYKYTPVLGYAKKEIGKRGLAKWIKDCAYDPKRKDFTPYTKY